MQFLSESLKLSITLPALIFLLFCYGGMCHAQSIDISAPSPVRSNELLGSIAARDLGDSRLTDHFYSFIGKPGDVLITVQGKNLNGDVDVFTAGTLRPLLKFTLYAESYEPVTKSIYLRRRQDLILRVEARTPNDDEGSYNIRLGGSFEPIASEALIAESETPAEGATRISTRRNTGRRVSSVGARIDEPAPPPEEIATAATPEPTPESSPTPSPTPEPTVEETPTASPRRTRGRRPTGRRTTAPRPVKKEEPPAVDDAEKKAAVTNEGENKDVAKASEAEPVTKPATTPRRRGRRGAAAVTTQPPLEPEPLTGPRLLIEMQDGTHVERYMSTIRRVTIENNQIVVVGKEGKTERISMTGVVRMAIE